MSASFAQAIKGSFPDSLGDIVFGIGNPTVSIFDHVFGVAASAVAVRRCSWQPRPEAAAPVSMAAGTFLDVETARGQARAGLAQKPAEIAHEFGKKPRRLIRPCRGPR
jgi:hypothetical protein